MGSIHHSVFIGALGRAGAVAALNSNPAPFSQSVCKFLGYGFSFVVLIMFLRNWFPFAIVYAPFVILASGIFLFILRKIANPNFRIEIPRPTRSDVMPFIPSTVILFPILLYFAYYPIFPEFNSADFSQHADLLRAILSGQSFPIASQILYFGYLYVLAVPMAFSHTTLAGPVPLVQIQIEMACMTVVSPLFFYLAAVKLFDSHRIAWMTALVWALGYGWFAMVFDSGLYSNFYGVIAAVFLVAAAKDFLVKETGVLSLGLLALAVFNAYLSHYATLTLIPVVAVFALVFGRKERVFRRGLLVATVLLAPVALGAIVLPQIAGTLVQLASGGNASPFLATGHVAFLPKMPDPFLSSFVFLFANDYFASAMLVFLGVSAYVAIRRRKAMLFLPIAWFCLIAAASSLNASSWRLAVESFVPLTLIVGFLLGKLVDGKRQVFKRQALLLVVFLFLLGNSWTIHAVADSIDQGPEGANAQVADYRAMMWMKANIPSNETALSVSDSNFRYSSFLSSTDVRFNLSGFAAPEIASGMASQFHTSYVIATNLIVGAQPFTCSYPFALSLSTNASQVLSGSRVMLHLSVQVFDPANLKVDGTAAIFGNGAQLGTVNLHGGQVNFTAYIPEHGNYTFYALIADEATSPMTILSTSHPQPRWIQSTPSQTPTSCYPWSTFTWQRLGCHNPSCLVYSNQYVKIWKVKGT